MKILSFGECDKNLIFPLIGGVSKLIVNLIIYFFPDEVELDNHPFILGITAGMGMTLSIIPYLYIEKCDKKQKKKKLLTSDKSLDEIEKKDDAKIKRNKYLFLFLCAFLDFIQKDLVFLFRSNDNNNIWMFNIIFLNVFSLIIIKNPIFRHQYLSLGIMVILGIVLNALDLQEMKLAYLPILFLNIFIEIIYSLEIVLSKYVLEYSKCSPFEITICDGLFSLICNIVILIITTNTPLDKNFKYKKVLKISEYEGEKYIDNFYVYINKMNFTEGLLFIVTMIGRLLFNLFVQYTLKHFNTSYVLLILILGDLTLDLLNKSALNLIMTVLILIFEFFMLFIFCEIIELNFCGLDKYTKRNIQDRIDKKKYGDDDDDDEEEDDENKEDKEIWNGLELNSEEVVSDNSGF